MPYGSQYLNSNSHTTASTTHNPYVYIQAAVAEAAAMVEFILFAFLQLFAFCFWTQGIAVAADSSMSEVDSKDHYPLPPSFPSSFLNGSRSGSDHHGSTKYSGHNQKIHYNRLDAANPDAAPLRDQWKYATKQYSKWCSHSWGTSILAGLAPFALGWVIKGKNPLLSFRSHDSSSSSSDDGDKPCPWMM